MGRLSAGPRVGISARLALETYRRLKQAAHDRGTSVNHLLNVAAEHYLDHLPPIEVDESVKE